MLRTPDIYNSTSLLTSPYYTYSVWYDKFNFVRCNRHRTNEIGNHEYRLQHNISKNPKRPKSQKGTNICKKGKKNTWKQKTSVLNFNLSRPKTKKNWRILVNEIKTKTSTTRQQAYNCSSNMQNKIQHHHLRLHQYLEYFLSEWDTWNYLVGKKKSVLEYEISFVNGQWALQPL